MFILSDSDEVQRQQLHKCMLHGVSHTKQGETLCGIHKQ